MTPMADNPRDIEDHARDKPGSVKQYAEQTNGVEFKEANGARNLPAARNGASGTDKPLKFPPLLWKDIAFDIEEEWAVEGVFPRAGLGCIYGGPGGGKTFITVDIFQRMAAGGLWAGRDVKQGPVVYIAAEGSNGIKKRIVGLKKIRAAKGLPEDIPFYLITVAPNFGTGDADRKELIQCIEALGIRPVAIAIDTLAQSLGGADENGQGMGQLIVNANALIHHFDCLVILVHHVPLSDEDRLRGGTNLIGALDVSILSKRGKGSMTAVLTIKKLKDDDDEQSFTIKLVRVVLGQTFKGREVSTLVVDSVEEGGGEGLAAASKRKLPDSAANALTALKHAIKDLGAYPPADKTPPIPSRTICVSKEQWRSYAYAASVKDNPDTKQKDFVRGVERLQSEKIIGIWEGYVSEP
jgi:hypothetical protein